MAYTVPSSDWNGLLVVFDEEQEDLDTAKSLILQWSDVFYCVTPLPSAGAASLHGGLAGGTQPLPLGDAVEGGAQTEQVEGLVALVTQDELVILTWRKDGERENHHHRRQIVKAYTVINSIHTYLIV